MNELSAAFACGPMGDARAAFCGIELRSKKHALLLRLDTSGVLGLRPGRAATNAPWGSTPQPHRQLAAQLAFDPEEVAAGGPSG